MSGKKGQKRIKLNEDSERYPEYYKKRNPDWDNNKCLEEAKKFRRSCNYQCIEYYEKNYPDLSHEEHLKIKKDLQIQKRNNNPNYIEYYNKRFPELSLQECEKKLKEYRNTVSFQNIEYYNKRFPELSLQECEKKLKEAKKSYLNKRPNLKGENNPMHHSKRSELQRKQISPKCIEFYELKYPELTHEDHLKMLKDHFKLVQNKIKNTIKDTNIEYYLNKGMTLEDAKIALKERQSTFTLEKCIKKYGEIEGRNRFNERQEKWNKKIKKCFLKEGDGRSYQSKFANTLIKFICEYLNIKNPKKEKFIYSKKEKKGYAYDFCFEHHIIEFNGDYWHANPKLYNEDYIHKTIKKTAKEIWESDKLKVECAKLYGYDVLTIWENDFNEDPQRELNKCIDFLTNDK